MPLQSLENVAEGNPHLQHVANTVGRAVSTSLRRFSIAEWCYSAIDRGYFLRNEFDECLAEMRVPAVRSRLCCCRWVPRFACRFLAPRACCWLGLISSRHWSFLLFVPLCCCCCGGAVGAGQVNKLCRAEWAAIRTVMGRPRRLSATFLAEERGKLERYRHDVRLVQQGRVRGVRVCAYMDGGGRRATCCFVVVFVVVFLL